MALFDQPVKVEPKADWRELMHVYQIFLPILDEDGKFLKALSVDDDFRFPTGDYGWALDLGKEDVASFFAQAVDRGVAAQTLDVSDLPLSFSIYDTVSKVIAKLLNLADVQEALLLVNAFSYSPR